MQLRALEKESIMLALDEFGNALLTGMPNVMIWKAHPVFDELPSHDLASWNWKCMPNVVK